MRSVIALLRIKTKSMSSNSIYSSKLSLLVIIAKSAN